MAERQGQTAALNMLGLREPFDAVPFFWSQHYDIPINYVGHAEKWDDLAVEGDIAGKDGLVRMRRDGRTLAVASVFRDLESLEAEVSLERESAARERRDGSPELISHCGSVSPKRMDADGLTLATLTEEIRACRVCRDAPRYGPPLPHEPRPVFQVSPSARICIAGQAPGVRVHASGRPYTDPSGVRLRSWLDIGEDVFYDPRIVSVVAMGFCFPGLDAKGGDLPPRRECAELWRKRMFAALPNLELILLVGQYAQKWHLGPKTRRQIFKRNRRPLARHLSRKRSSASRAHAPSLVAQQRLAQAQSLVRGGTLAGPPRGHCPDRGVGERDPASVTLKPPATDVL